MRCLSISQAPQCISLAGINFQGFLQLGLRICNMIYQIISTSYSTSL
jgi:hypothetical protein